MTTVTLVRSGAEVLGAHSDHPGVQVNLIDVGPLAPEAEHLHLPELNPNDPLAVTLDGHRQAALTVLSTATGEISEPLDKASPPLMLIAYGDYTYVTLGQRLLVGAYSEDCRPDTLVRLMLATHPGHTVREVDGRDVIKQQWQREHPGADPNEIDSEAEIVQRLLAYNPQAFEQLDDLRDLSKFE